MAEDKILADGMFFKVRDNQPEWVIGKCSIKVETFIEFLRLHENNGYVNLDVIRSKAGKPYATLDIWKPTPQPESEVNNRPVTQMTQDSWTMDESDTLPF